MTIDFDVKSLLPLVREAGTAIKSYYGGTYTKTIKEDLSPLTEADRKSNQILVAGLKQIFPGLPVISEEAEDVPYSVRRNWPYYFLIDPLDGTRQFIQNIPEFTVNVALIHNNRPIMGLIHLPTTEVTWLAQRGIGAFRFADQFSRLPLSDNTPKTVVIVKSKTDSSAGLQRLISAIPDAQVQAVSSSLKFCAIAEGTADFYPRLIPSMEWDTAAGSILVEESGGQVCDLEGDAILYNRENSLNPPFYAIGKHFFEKVPSWKDFLFQNLYRRI